MNSHDISTANMQVNMLFAAKITLGFKCSNLAELRSYLIKHHGMVEENYIDGGGVGS